MALRRRFNLSCLNLSCGYHNWHRSDDYVVVEEVEAAVNAGEALIAALGCRSYPFDAGADDLSEPLFEVTGLADCMNERTRMESLSETTEPLKPGTEAARCAVRRQRVIGRPL